MRVNERQNLVPRAGDRERNEVRVRARGCSNRSREGGRRRQGKPPSGAQKHSTLAARRGEPPQARRPLGLPR